MQLHWKQCETQNLELEVQELDKQKAEWSSKQPKRL